MLSLLRAWGSSLSFFDPRNVLKFILQVASTYVRALRMGIPLFIGMILIDSSIMYAYVGKTLLFFNVDEMADTTSLFGTLSIALLWQFGSLIFLLSLRKTITSQPSQSFAYGLLRLLQWLFMSELVLLVLKIILIDCGIQVFPQVNWMIVSALVICMQSCLFFWLDTKFSLREMPRVFEKMVNFVFYNLPFFSIICALSIAINHGLSFCLSMKAGENMLKLLYSSGMGQKAVGVGSILQFMAFKYGVFLVSVIPLTLLFVLYMVKRNKQYAKPFF